MSFEAATEAELKELNDTVIAVGDLLRSRTKGPVDGVTVAAHVFLSIILVCFDTPDPEQMAIDCIRKIFAGLREKKLAFARSHDEAKKLVRG